MTSTCPTCGRPALGPLPDGTQIPTPMQTRVLQMVDAGLTTREIASELWLSIETVRWHLKQAYRRLGVHDRADAVGRARQLGLLEEDDAA